MTTVRGRVVARRESVAAELLELLDAALTAKISRDVCPERVRPALLRVRELVDGLLGDGPVEVGVELADDVDQVDEGGGRSAGVGL